MGEPARNRANSTNGEGIPVFCMVNDAYLMKRGLEIRTHVDERLVDVWTCLFDINGTRAGIFAINFELEIE